MRHNAFTRQIYGVAGSLQFLAGVVAAIVPGTLKADTSKPGFPQPWKDLIDWIQPHAWWVIPLAVVSVGLLGLIRKWIGAPWVTDHLQTLLDSIRNIAFPAEEYPDGHHCHRVTLFKSTLR